MEGEQSQTEGSPGESWMVLRGHASLKEYMYALRALHMCVCGRDLQRVCDSQKLESNCYPFPRRG